MAASRRLLRERAATKALPLGYRAFVPDGCETKSPLVIVHGCRGGAGRYFRAFLPEAISLNMPLIVPTFSDDRFHGYQRLAGVDGPLAAQEALAVTLADAQTVLGVNTATVDLLGFSGGAQFVHRFSMTAPEGVGRVVVAAAGWYTFLDPSRPFPYGCAASAASGGRSLDVGAFLRLPVHVLVGERDVGRDASLRTGKRVDHRQGRDRLSRALRWIDHVEDAARQRGVESRITFDLLPASGHSFTEAVRKGGLVNRTKSYLHAEPRASFGQGGAWS